MQWLIVCLSWVALFIGAEKKQTICLNMIVKNESRVIERCLESVKPLIDCWAISDTGSTDGTQEIIRNCMKGIPGELKEHSWVDFAYNRNLALDMATGKADYILFIDADEVFAYDPKFQFPKLDLDYYHISVQNERGGVFLSEYKRVLLIKDGLKWAWKGVLHETIESDLVKTWGFVDGIVNISRTEEGFRFQDPNKFLNDAKVLEKALLKEPNNTRYVFYIAQSYLGAKEPQKALEFFEKRVQMEPGRFDSAEIFISLYYIGVLSLELKKESAKIIESFERAYRYLPSRAEPLYQLASHFVDKQNYLVAEILLKNALTLPLPTQNVHYVETWVYEWGLLLKLAECLFKAGQFRESKGVIQKLLCHPHFPQEQVPFLKENLALIDQVVLK